MKASLVILSFFATGLLLGLFHWFPAELLTYNISFYVLCALMFSVGISIGNDPTSFRQFRHLNPRLIFLPLMTMVGTLLGMFAVSFFLKGRSVAECMAIGSGFGYYSLSSILITQYKGIELGTIALLSNIMREVITLLLAPWMVKYFGKLSPISAGGATTMDTTFPIIIRYSGKEFAIVSIYHGFIMDFSVPFLVTFFCSL
ncbi:MAG TPA: lysine exporter LysO family protein [Paludibacter sp.]